jgi:hypothetical protein
MGKILWVLLAGLAVIGLWQGVLWQEMAMINGIIFFVVFWKKTRSNCAFYLAAGLLSWLILTAYFLAKRSVG